MKVAESVTTIEQQKLQSQVPASSRKARVLLGMTNNGKVDLDKCTLSVR